MAKATSRKSLTSVRTKAEVMDEVQQHIAEAAMLLRSLGKDYEKAAWVLEDSLQFVSSESGQSDLESFDRDTFSAKSIDWASFIAHPLENFR